MLPWDVFKDTMDEQFIKKKVKSTECKVNQSAF